MTHTPNQPTTEVISGRDSGCEPREPELSFFVAARNDGFTGNFNWRFATSLNYLADNLQQLGKLNKVEVVVTDWGSEVPLHKVLPIGLAARRILRFVLVPPSIAGQLQGDSEFPVVLAQNAAVRRCRGEYIAQMDSDNLVTPAFLNGLFAVLDGSRNIGTPVDRVLFGAKRRHVPFEYVAQSPDIRSLIRFINLFGRLLPIESSKECQFLATGMMLMHRQLWEECGGYDERLIYRGMMEIDLGRRILRKFSWVDLTNQGLSLFHLEHHPMRIMANRKWNPSNWESREIHPNCEDWGLKQYQLEIVSYMNEATALPTQHDFPCSYRAFVAAAFHVILCSLKRLLRSTTVERFEFLRRFLPHYRSVKRWWQGDTPVEKKR